MKPKKYTLTINFATLEEAVAFSERIDAFVGLSLYYGDVLDKEFRGGSVPAGSLVLRPTGHKPDEMKVSV